MRPVTGCGVIANHTIIEQWECGGASCPPCSNGSQCINHSCINATINATTDFYVGRNTSIHAEINGKPCARCEIEITDPSGRKFTATTDDAGNVQLPLNDAGTYTAALVKNQKPLASTPIKTLKPPQVVSTNPLTLVLEQNCPLLLVVLLVALALYLRWRAGKKQKL